MATTFSLGEGKGEEARAFPILYYDHHNLFPSLLPFIEARLPLDGVPIKNPFSPHAAVYCNTLHLKFINHDALTDPAVPSKNVGSGSSAAAAAAAAAAAKLTGASPAIASAGISAAASAAHAPAPAAVATAASVIASVASNPGGGQPGPGGIPAGRQGRLAAAPTAATTGSTRPYVYLQILQLENIEDYKTHHRRILRAWVDNLTEQHEEWLVLYVTPFSESETQSRSFRKILDKLRSDLNPPGSRSRERFLRVPTDPTGQYSHAPVFHDLWNAFMLRLKEALAAAVEGRYVQLEDEVQRQSQAPEPRFCAVFAAKEDLALLHALCNRPDEALAVLDSLDLLRNTSGGRGLYEFQVTSSDVPPWRNFFHTFGFASSDAEVPVLLNQKRLARLQAALREDKISYIDFRQYLFARQAELLLRLNRLEELGARAIQLISSVYKELLSKNISTGAHTWALLAALNFAGYIVAQATVPTERFAVTREVSEATPRSMAVDEGSPWRSSRPHEFTASPSSSTTTPAGSPYGSVTTHPLLPLKYPTLASAARTLHRFTPLQFSFSPTRRGHAAHRGRVPAGSSSLQPDAPVAPAPAAADSAAESLEAGGVEEIVANKEGSHGNAGAAASPSASAGAAPAPAARYAGVLYGYAAQQLQRLIQWRRRSHWYAPLKEIPLTDTDSTGQLRGSAAGESALSDAAVDSAAVEAATGDGSASGEKAAAVRRSCAAAGQQDGSEEDPTEGGGVDDEPFFGPADTDQPEDLLLTFSRKSLLEELQTATATEDMLARIFVLAGQQYMNGGYYRHAALLQYRLAAANFRRGCLEECRSFLARLLPLFLKEPWTELWLECQQLLCEADRRAGDVEAELRSAYVLSSVKAQYCSSRLRSRAARMQRKTEGGAAGASGGAAAAPLLQAAASGTAASAAAPQVTSVWTAGTRQAADGGSREASTTQRFPVNPREFLQRFITLARSQQAEPLSKPPRDAGEAAASKQRDGVRPSPLATDAVAKAAAAEEKEKEKEEEEETSTAATSKGSAAGGAATSATPPAAETRGEVCGAVNAGATDEEVEQLPLRMPTCTVLSDLDFCESLRTEERSLHLSSSPNLYCWAALTAWWPAEDGLGEGIPRECLQPALALASAATLAPTEPLVASSPLASGLPHFYGGGSVEGTPYTLTSMTPTGASTTASFFSHTLCASGSDPSAATGGRLAALLSSRRHVLSSLPPDGLMGVPSSSSPHTSFPHTGLASGDAAGVLRGSHSRAEAGQDLPHNGGGILKGSCFSLAPRSPATSQYGHSPLRSPVQAVGGTGVLARNFLRARSSIDNDLLEHAVLRQLADLLPLYRLPCHPELGPHAYLFAYVATLLRLKPKSVAQVLGQHQRLRLRRSGAPQRDRVRSQEQQQLLAAAGDQPEPPELKTVAASEREGDAGEEQLLSRPRSTVRAASEGTTKKRPRGSNLIAFAAETDVSPAEAATPAGEQGAVNRSSSGLSGGLRDFRWRRSKTLTHVGQVALPKEAGGTADGGEVKGDQCPEPFAQLTTREAGQRSNSRNTKGAGRVSLLLSRRRRSTTSAAAASVSATAAIAAAVEAARRAGKKAVSAGEQAEQALPNAAKAASATATGGRTQSADADPAGGGGAAAAGGGPATRLPEQFRSCAQQLPAAALDSSVHPKVTTAVDRRQSPALPLQQTRPREAPGSQATSAEGAASGWPHQQFYGRRQLGVSEPPAGASAGAAPRSRALSVLEMSSMQNVLPSLSVSLGQHIELQLYVHSCLAGPLPADYVAVRLSQLPTTCLDSQLGGLGAAGSMRTEPPRLNLAASRFESAAGEGLDPSSASHLGGRGKDARLAAAASVAREEEEEVFLQQHAGAAASMWLVARSGQGCACRSAGCSKTVCGESEDQAGKQSLLSDETVTDKLVLRPGINRLSLLWSSRVEGVFVLEQICVGVGAAALVQWAGDLPLPDMMDAVAQVMQKVLLTASLQQQRWRGQQGGASPSLPSGTAPAETETSKGKTGKTPGSSSTQRAAVSAAATHAVGPPLADAAEAGGAADTASGADSSVKVWREGSSNGSSQRGGVIPASASNTPASCAFSETVAVGKGAAASEGHQHVDGQGNANRQEAQCCWPLRQSKNPLFQPVDCGNLASANAFEERADPPAWLLQQLALGCSPLAATLLQPVAPLERMLRPLIFEVRSPSTAVQIHVQAASPSDSFLFLDARNFVVVRIDVMPGLFAGPTPCRLRVLQCLLPVSFDEQQEGATGHLLRRELQMQDSFLLSEGGAETSAAAGRRDSRSFHGSMAAGGRRGSQFSRLQRQAASAYRGRSGQQDKAAPAPVGAAAASPGLIPRSPGTASAATWRRYFREGGGNSYRTPQSLLYRQGSMAAALEADRLGRYNSLLNCGSSTHGGAATAAYGERYRRSHSFAQTDKEAFSSPCTSTIQAFDPAGLPLDDQQLFEAAAVHLQFQWQQAVTQRVDGVPVYRRLGGPEEALHTQQRDSPASGAASAAAGDERDQRAEEARSQAKHQKCCSASGRFFDSSQVKTGGETPAAWRADQTDCTDYVGGGVAVSASDPSHSNTASGEACCRSYESGTRTHAHGEPLWSQRHGFLRICAEDEDGDVLALVPQQSEAGPRWRTQRSSSCRRADSSRAASEPLGRLRGDACWLELPPFQTSCEVLVPVIPLWADACESSYVEPHAAAASADACAASAPNEDAHTASEPGALPLLASKGNLRPHGSLDGLTDGEREDGRGKSPSTALRPHSGGRPRVYMGAQENASSPVNKERWPSWCGQQQLGRLPTKEEMSAEAFSRRRLSSSGSVCTNPLQLRSCGSRRLTLLRVGWGEERPERSVTEQCVDELLLPCGFPFRRRRSAFIVPPSFSLTAGAEEMCAFDGGREAAEAAAYAGTGGRMTAEDAGAQELPQQSPAARAAQRISMAAMLNRQQQLQEQHHRDRQQEQLRQQQQPELWQQHFSSTCGCLPPPLEYHVHIVTTLQFYTRTGIPAAAAARVCQEGSSSAACSSSAPTSPAKSQQQLHQGCRSSSCEGPPADSEGLCESADFAGESLAPHINDLGVHVPSIYPRTTAAARRNTETRVCEDGTRISEIDKGDTVYTKSRQLAQAGIATVNMPSEGTDGGSASPAGGNECGVAAADFVRHPSDDSAAAAESSGSAAGRAASRSRGLSPMRTAAAGAASESVEREELERSDGIRRRVPPQAEEEEGPVEDIAEEPFDSVEVCAQETIWLRQQQRKELAALLAQDGGRGGGPQEQEATADDMTTPSRDRVEGRTVASVAGKRRGETSSGGKPQEGQQLRVKTEAPAAWTEKARWRSLCAQPAIIMQASTSRVHRLAVRVALQHSERLLHVSKDALLQQVLLSSCCSPAEPVVVESASIVRLPTGRSEEDELPPTEEEGSQDEDEARKRTDKGEGSAEPTGTASGEEAAARVTDARVEKSQRQRNKEEREEHSALCREKHRRRRRRLHWPKTKVSLIAPPPAGLTQQMSFFASPQQEAEAVRLDSLLFGEKVTALLVRVEHRRRHRRRFYVSDADARGKRASVTQSGESVRESAGRSEGGARNSGSKAAEDALLSRRIRAAFESKLDAYLLSIHYRFLKRREGKKRLQPSCAAGVTAASAAAVSLAAGDQELYVNNNDEATTQDTETTETEEEAHAGDELLVYKIPLVFPVQQFPFEVRFHAPRIGRVSAPLVVGLVFTNCSDVQLDVRHVVSLEFDDESGLATRAAAKFFSQSPLLSSRSVGSRMHLQCSRFYQGAGSLRLLDNGTDGARLFSGWRGTTAGAAAAADDPGKGSTSKKDSARSSRLGECHDWLMVGSKCKTTTVAACSTARVHFHLVPLRAGSLPLPTVRVRIRPSSEAQRRLLANSFSWQYPAGGESAAAVANGSDASAGAVVSAAAASAERAGKIDSSPLLSPDTFSLSGQNLWHRENGPAPAKAANPDWWLPVSYGESVTAGREILVLPKVVSKPDARLLPD